ncbi:MAG TPA: sigma-70 family RNA polymerase sigma factor [Kofleriaceae bacterium]|nr:sigma-70 family RNA polymerase sigma factor [Kofleriaceae bacterium]
MGDRELAALYERWGFSLYRRCLAYLGNEAEAQDAVQEVFARAIEAAPRFRAESSPAAWLRQIADNLCIDLLRRRRRNPVRGDASDDERAGDTLDRFTAPSGEHLILAHRLILSLQPDAARIAVLYFLDGMTQEEVAVETGLSRRTIGKRLQAIVSAAHTLIANPEPGA